MDPAAAGPYEYEAVAARRRILTRRREALAAGAAHPGHRLMPAAGSSRPHQPHEPHHDDLALRLARARQRNAEARKEMANAMAFIRENGPSKQQEDEEEEDDEYRDQARRALRQAQKAFKALVEEEVSFLSDGYVRRLQLVVAGVEPAKQGQGEYRDNEEERDAGSSWLDRRQRRARENERVVKRLFEQQCKRRLTAT